MREYLIRAADGSGWIPIHRKRLPDVLLPRGWNARQSDGWGDFRIEVDGAQIAFSGEDPGWQVVIEGDMDPATADKLLETLRAQIEAATGTPAEVVVLTP